jgi:hypothetical protein
MLACWDSNYWEGGIMTRDELTRERDEEAANSRSKGLVVQSLREQLVTLESSLAEAVGVIKSEVALLRAWARESREGGWSTHQVDPMNRRADDLSAVLSRLAAKETK